MAVAQQPMPLSRTGDKLLIGSLAGHRDWDNGLLSCFSDCKTLAVTCFCLPFVLCNISSRQEDIPCMPYFVPGSLVAIRARIRTLGGIRLISVAEETGLSLTKDRFCRIDAHMGSICGDFLTTTICGLCSICQMERELTNMGL